MATTEQFDVIRATDLIPAQGNNAQVQLVTCGDGLIAGAPLRKLDTSGYMFISRIPALGTPLPTGLTFGLILVDDPNNTGAGLVIRVGITVKLLATGTDTLTFTGAATETEASITMDATTGEYTLSSVAIANAALDSLAASSVYLVRIRRIGTAATDTHTGTVLLLGVTVRDT